MADAELRELERAFAASGDVEDEARWLQALVRAGRLDEERLRLAALLGSAAARRLSPAKPPKVLGTWLQLVLRHSWPAGAGWGAVPLGWQAVVRAAVALARGHRRLAGLERVEAAEAWCLCPCPEHSRLAWEATRQGAATSVVCARPARLASGVAGTNTFPGQTWFLGVVKTARWSEGTKELGGVEPARAVVEAELVAWALGRADPVRHRVEARRG